MRQLHRAQVQGRRRYRIALMKTSGLLAWLVRVASCTLVWVGSSWPAQASGHSLQSPHSLHSLDAESADLASADSAVVSGAIRRMSGADDSRALPILEALDDGKLRIDASGHAFIANGSKLKDALAVSGAETAPVGALSTPAVDNTIRRALLPALAALRLSSTDATVRLGAAQELAKRASEESTALLRAALGREKDARVKTAMQLALAEVDIDSTDPQRRLAAIGVIA